MARLLRWLAISSALSVSCAATSPDDLGDESVDDASEGVSNVVAKNAKKVKLIVDANGVARIGYTDSAGKRHRVLAWGAINAIKPDKSKAQVGFKFNFSGGYGSKWGTGYWKEMKNVCGPYTGPKLPLLVTACTAPDGSHWALQSWRRLMPNGGYKPKPGQAPYELHLSHWKGPLPTFEVSSNWTPGNHVDRLFGQLLYKGEGVYGFASKPNGDPLDAYGRNVFIDVLNPYWGSGWYRFNSGLTHNPKNGVLDGGGEALGGNFCLGMYALYGRTKPAEGDRYRLTVMGPGVMPILRWEGPPPGTFSVDAQKAAKVIEREFVPTTDSCY
jgi:hypothetical protein